jgi:hypothetical protein
VTAFDVGAGGTGAGAGGGVAPDGVFPDGVFDVDGFDDDDDFAGYDDVDGTVFGTFVGGVKILLHSYSLLLLISSNEISFRESIFV